MDAKSNISAKNTDDAPRYLVARSYNPIIAWAVLLLSISLTVAAYFASKRLVDNSLQEKFEFRSNEIAHAIEDRLFVYEQILWSGAALFHAQKAQNVSRQQWADFVLALDIEKNWPGIQGMGFSIPVDSDGKDQHERMIQSEGFNDYMIRPEGNRDQYSAIIYLEPFDWRNKRAFGYDMWSNAMRRAAMKRARDEGVAATSGIITLVQETDNDVQRGFLTYVPVYLGNQVPSDTAERQSKFLGWVYAPFRAGDLMAGILGSEDKDIVFDVYDGKDIGTDALLYTSSDDTVVTNKNRMASKLTKTAHIELQGRPWTLVFRTQDDFILSEGSSVPNFVALCGLVINLLILYVIVSLYFIDRKAKNIATKMTLELQKAKDSLEVQVEERTSELKEAHNELEAKVHERTLELNEKVTELERMNKLTSGRELRIIELKQEVNVLSKALGKNRPYQEHSPTISTERDT